MSMFAKHKWCAQCRSKLQNAKEYASRRKGSQAQRMGQKLADKDTDSMRIRSQTREEEEHQMKMHNKSGGSAFFNHKSTWSGDQSSHADDAMRSVKYQVNRHDTDETAEEQDRKWKRNSK